MTVRVFVSVDTEFVDDFVYYRHFNIISAFNSALIGIPSCCVLFNFSQQYLDYKDWAPSKYTESLMALWGEGTHERKRIGGRWPRRQ